MVRATSSSGDFRTLTAAASSTEYYGDLQFNMIDLGDLITREQIKTIIDMEEVLRVRIL